MTTQDINLFSGNTVDLIVTVTDANGVAIDLSGATISYIIVSSDGQTLLTKTNAEAAEISCIVNVITIYLLPADTASVNGFYTHDLEITDASGNVVTSMNGSVIIKSTLQ